MVALASMTTVVSSNMTRMGGKTLEWIPTWPVGPVQGA